MRSCTSPFAVKPRVHIARSAAPGPKRSTAATSVTLLICRSPDADPLLTSGCADFAAISRGVLARPSLSKYLHWRSATPTERAGSGRCSKRSGSPLAAGQGVGTAGDQLCQRAAARCCGWCVRFLNGQSRRQRCWVSTSLRSAGAGATARFWWMPMLIASLTCWKIRLPTRSSRGSAIIRVPKLSAATGTASTPVLPGAVRPTHSRWQIGGTWCTTWLMRWNASRCECLP